MLTTIRVLTIAIVGAGLVATGCGHNGSITTPHGNDIILDKYGAPNFVGKPNRCPGQNSDGDIELSWKTTGKTRVKGECKGGVMVGTWKAYYENGATVWKAKFQHGLIVGTFKSWYANDEKRAKVDFREGIPHGDFKAWHFNGDKRAKGEFVGGKRNGCWETWHDNGQKESKGTYADGQKVLTWLYWTASGQKRKDKVGGRAVHGKCLITL